MILAFAVVLLQAGTAPVTRVDIVTAATEVIVSGRAGAHSVSVIRSEGLPAPAVTRSHGIVTIRDTDEDAGILSGRYEIELPSSAAVNLRVRCRVKPDKACPNATIRISGVSAVEYESFDGHASISRISGDVKAVTLTGRLDIRTVGGAVEASSQTNAIDLDGAAGNAMLRSTTGAIAINSVRGNVTATNTTGEIMLAGHVSSGSRYELATDIGHIRIHIDRTSDATVEVNAPAEALRIRLAGARTTAAEGRRRTVVIGSGSARIAARTLGGAVDIGRRP